MKYKILLNKDDKTKEIEAQEQARFIKSILEAIDIPIQWNPDEPLSINDKIKFRNSLHTYGIHIIDDMDGGLKIFAKDELVAEWTKAKYKLKEDPSNINPNKRLYLEMNIEFWSLFEEATQ